MTKQILIVFFLLTTSVSCFAQLTPAELQIAGQAKFQSKEYADAYRLFQQRLTILASDATSEDYLEAGLAAYVGCMYLDSENTLSKLVSRWPNVTKGWLYLAKTQAKLDHAPTSGTPGTLVFGRAVEAFDAFFVLAEAETDPVKREKTAKDRVTALEYLVVIDYSRGNFLAACQKIDKIQDIAPDQVRYALFKKQFNCP
jgi:tetratricopeptide (TPR) repeat protein